MSDIPLILSMPRAVLDDTDGDCACADSFASSKAASRLPRFEPGVRYAPAPGLVELPLAGDYTLIFDRMAGGSGAVLNQAALALLRAPAAPGTASGASQAALQTLVERGFLRSGPAAARAPVQPSTLVAWLHLAPCNLNCLYCYAPPGGEAMSPAVGEAAVAAAFRTAQAHGFQNVKLKYAGGEPTLNFATVLAAHDRAAALSRRTHVPLSAVLLTNGLNLTDTMLADLKKRQIAVMVSLDGLGPVHDRQRPLPGGEGSFGQVAQTIERLINAGMPPQISITLTRHNLDSLPQTLAWLLDRDLRFHLNFYRERGRSAAAGAMRASNGELIAGLLKAYAFLETRLPTFSLLNSLLDRVQLSSAHEHACGAGRNYLAIGPRGGVAICHMHIDRPVADLGPDDVLASVRSRSGGELPAPGDDGAGCQPCLWRYACAGGCPWEQRSYCTVYRRLAPEVLRLEGLRRIGYTSSVKHLFYTGETC